MFFHLLMPMIDLNNSTSFVLVVEIRNALDVVFRIEENVLLHDLAIPEVESNVLAIKGNSGRLQAPHCFPHAVVPHFLRVLVSRHAHGGRRNRRVLRDALEAEAVTGWLRP